MDNTRGRRHARTAQAVLDAALEIISESNIEALSMREIARRIDYSPSGLYEYFASKDELLDALRRQGFEKLTEHIKLTVRGSTASQRLLESGMAYLDFARRSPQLYLLMFNRVPGQIEEARKPERRTTNSAFAALIEIIRAGVESGAFKVTPNVSIEQMAYSNWAHVHGLAMLRLTLLSTTTEDIDTLNREVLRAFIERMCVS
jgi:AcrR family transcriptional regulator